MVFDVELPMSEKSPNKLSIKCWDKDPMTFSNESVHTQSYGPIKRRNVLDAV